MLESGWLEETVRRDPNEFPVRSRRVRAQKQTPKEAIQIAPVVYIPNPDVRGFQTPGVF